jgi:ketosteroid isomerase-like protein
MTDEQQLRDIQQRLADAWLRHDQAAIAAVLAPEWSVTQPDGSILTREAVLTRFFDAAAFDSMVVDDVSVLLFGDAAVVRGHTRARATMSGTAVTGNIRFTDLFIKRDGRWQAVASHASALAA